MASATSERIELAKLCSSGNWSKAIRVLNSLLAESCEVQDICNRAFCYSQLELHKHVIKDCDKALQLDPTFLQAYTLKGNAFYALGKKEEAFSVWKKGYEHALHQTADMKQLLELKDLLIAEKQDKSVACENHLTDSRSSSTVSKSGQCVNDKTSELRDASETCSKSNNNLELCNGKSDKDWWESSMPVSGAGLDVNGKSSEASENHGSLSYASKISSESRDSPETDKTSSDNFNTCNGFSDKARVNEKLDNQMNGTYAIQDRLNSVSESSKDSSATSESCSSLSISSCNSTDSSEVRGKLGIKFDGCSIFCFINL